MEKVSMVSSRLRLILVAAGTALFAAGCAYPAPQQIFNTFVKIERIDEQAAEGDVLTDEEESVAQPDAEGSEALITYEELVEANSVDKLLSKHGSYLAELTIVDDEYAGPKSRAYGANSFTIYNDADFLYYSTDFRGFERGYDFQDSLYFADMAGCWRSRNENGEESLHVDYYAMSDEEKPYYIPDRDYFAVISDCSDMGEKIVSASDNGDGTLTVMTELPSEAYMDIGNMPEEWKGKVLEGRYIVDSESFELQEFSVKVLIEDGAVDYMIEKVTYDAEEPDGSMSLRTFEEDVRTKEPENPRTLTVIYDPGTEAEEVYTTVADTSYMVTIHTRDGYSLIEAPEGTAVPDGGTGENDVVLYAVKE